MCCKFVPPMHQGGKVTKSLRQLNILVDQWVTMKVAYGEGGVCLTYLLSHHETNFALPQRSKKPSQTPAPCS